MNLRELQPPGEHRNQATRSLASKALLEVGVEYVGLTREAVLSFSVLCPVVGSCTFLVFMGLGKAKIK